MKIVVGAAILRDGRLLAQQRGHPPEVAGLWELPGGGVEPGEDEPSALVRECWEELGVKVAVGERVGPDVMVRKGLVLRVYQAFLIPGDARPEARDHQGLRWLDVSNLDSVEWLPADRVLLPALAVLMG